jgi:hypothetical protein
MVNLGSEFLEHFERSLGPVVNRYVLDDPELPRKIQILEFHNVFQGCVTFATLGLCNYSNNTEGRFNELIVVTDDLVDHIPKIIFSVVRTIIHNNLKLNVGLYVTGLEEIDSSFCKVSGKSALYFTSPIPLPLEFEYLHTSNPFLLDSEEKPRIFMGLMISQKECEFIRVKGHLCFEDKLEQLDIDPFDICRENKI